MFICSVVQGNVKKEMNSNTTLTKNDVLSKGFDSVVGEPGKDLNYDEVVVYDEDAVLPRYLVVYK
jgi:hypothetical protein